MAQRVRPGTLTSAIRSRRPRSTTDTEYESGIEGSPTFAAIRKLRVGSNASPFGLTPTAILKAFCSSQGANTETVFSPRLLVKTRPRVSETSAPATPVRSGIDSMYRSRAQSITSMESLLVTSVRFFSLDNGISEHRTQLWILASKVDDRVGGWLVISTELLDRRRLYNLQRGILREFCERGEFSAARTTRAP